MTEIFFGYQPLYFPFGRSFSQSQFIADLITGKLIGSRRAVVILFFIFFYEFIVFTTIYFFSRFKKFRMTNNDQLGHNIAISLNSLDFFLFF